MSEKLRSVNTRFWEDPFIEGLTPNEKLLFLYLLTNPLTNLIGIYEITIRRISYDTGLKSDIIFKGLKGFGTVRKALFINGFIILPNFLKNQNLNDNMKTGVIKLFKSIPNELKLKLLGNDYQTLSNDYQTLRNGLLKLNGNRIEIEDEKETEKEVKILNVPFEVFWNLYDKKEDRIKCEVKWENLKDEERQKCIENLPAYIKSTPDKKYRKNPATFLNNKSWNNEIILPVEKPETLITYKELLEKHNKGEADVWNNYEKIDLNGKTMFKRKKITA
jgi:hypothetical protein